jgi:hypothetical protein
MLAELFGLEHVHGHNHLRMDRGPWPPVKVVDFTPPGGDRDPLKPRLIVNSS